MTQIEIELMVLAIGVLIAGMQIYGTAKIKSIAKHQGEIETKIKNLPELEQIAKAQASGKTSVEFDYQKRKDDSDRLVEFGVNISNIFAESIKANSFLCSELELIKMQGVIEELEQSEFKISSIKSRHSDLEKSIVSDEHYKSMKRLTVEYSIYFKKYDENFNVIFEAWQNEMNLMNDKRVELISNIMISHYDHGSILSISPETNSQIQNLVHEYTIKTILEKRHIIEMNDKLISAFEKLSRTIRAE